MKFDMPNTLMMSDSLKEKISISEDDVTQFEDAFIIAAISVDDYNLIVGSLIGLAVEDITLKIDLKVSILEAYNFISEVMGGRKFSVSFLELHYQTIKQMTGPFDITVARISDIDHANKMAILALDLVKTT